jgi:hypothetical protein
MKTKLLAAAVATAFFGLSSTASAQTPSGSSVNARSTPPSEQKTRTDSSTSGGSGTASAGAGAPIPGTSIGTTSVPSVPGAASEPSAGVSGKCEKLSGNEKANCLRKEDLATSGSGGGSTDRPGPESTGMGR